MKRTIIVASCLSMLSLNGMEDIKTLQNINAADALIKEYNGMGHASLRQIVPWIRKVTTKNKKDLGASGQVTILQDRMDDANRVVTQEIERLGKLSGWQGFRERSLIQLFTLGATGIVTCLALWFGRNRISPTSVLRPLASKWVLIPGLGLSSFFTAVSYNARYDSLRYINKRADIWLNAPNPFDPAPSPAPDNSPKSESTPPVDGTKPVGEVKLGDMYPDPSMPVTPSDHKLINS